MLVDIAPPLATVNTDGLGQSNPLTADEVVRRGQEAMERKRRSFDDWMLIAGALQIGRTEVMRVLHTNKPIGRRYEKAMGEWLLTRSFHLIDKCTRNHLLECLQRRTEIAKWRAALTEAERFSFNHPTTVLRKWKGSTVAPDPNAMPKLSPQAKLKAANIELQEELHRLKRHGDGNAFTKDDTPKAAALAIIGTFDGLNNKTTKVEAIARELSAWVKQQKMAAQ